MALPVTDVALFVSSTSRPDVVSPALNSVPVSVMSVPFSLTDLSVQPGGALPSRISRGPLSPFSSNVPSSFALAAPPPSAGPSLSTAIDVMRIEVSDGGLGPSKTRWPVALPPLLVVSTMPDTSSPATESGVDPDSESPPPPIDVARNIITLSPCVLVMTCTDRACSV